MSSKVSRVLEKVCGSKGRGVSSWYPAASKIDLSRKKVLMSSKAAQKSELEINCRECREGWYVVGVLKTKTDYGASADAVMIPPLPTITVSQ